MKWFLIFWIYGCSSADMVCETGDFMVDPEPKSSYSRCMDDLWAWKLTSEKGHEHRGHCLPVDRQGITPEYFSTKD